ncbi:MAG: SwmB domain-containing protein [Chloroflexota bacterium]|nr:SwmB domain-containing protein [Chloroflexota bacterium]
MRPSSFTPFLSRWPLFGLAALLLLIALAALLAGPGAAQAHDGHDGAPGHVHFTTIGAVTPGTPDPPTGWAEPGPGEGQITLHWTPAGPAATSWAVGYRKSAETMSQTASDDIPAAARSYTISGLEPGVLYWVAIEGENASGGGDFSVADNVAAAHPPPAFWWADVEGATLTVNFDRDLATGSAPAGSAFTVSATAPDGTARTISGAGTASISGKAATVTLASPVAHGETVRVSYARPSANPLLGAGSGGIVVAGFANRWTDNHTKRGAVYPVHFTDVGLGSSTGPNAPTGYAVPGPGGGQITLHWTPATSGPAAGEWGVLQRKSGTSGQFRGIGGISAATRSHTISGLEPGVAYDVEVRGWTGGSPNLPGDRARANNVVAAHPSPPGFLWARVEGATLTVNFDEDLDTASAPAGSAFTVSIVSPDGTKRTIAGTGTATVSGSAATVTLASVLAHRYNETVQVSYVKPSANPLRAHGDAVDGFANQRVSDRANLGHAHFFLTTPPGCETCPDMPTGYAEPGFGDGVINVHWTPAPTVGIEGSWWLFHEKTGDSDSLRQVPLAPGTRSHTISGLEPGVPYDVILVEVGGDGLGDRALAANVAAGVTDGPSFVGATVHGKALTVTFNRALNEDRVPPYDSFEVSTFHGGGEGLPRCSGECPVPVTGLSISGATVTLTLAQAIPSHGSATLKYERPTRNALVGRAIGYPANSFDYQQVTNTAPDVDAPLFSSAQLFPWHTNCDWSYAGGRLHWYCPPTYDEKAFLEMVSTELLDDEDEDRKPPTSAFRVTATPPGGRARTVAVTGVAYISGQQVKLVTGPVPGGKDATVTVSYVKPSANGLRDRAGNLLESFSGQPVTNGMPMIESIGLVSDPGPDRTYGFGEQVRVAVTFDTPVDVNWWSGRPRLKIDLTEESGGGQRWAQWDGRDDTETLTFIYTVAGTDVSTAGIAVARNPIDLNGSTISSFHAWPRQTANLSFSWIAHNPAHKVDWSLPVFQGAAVDGTSLTLTFDQTLDEDSEPSPGAFRVTVNGSRRGVARDGVAVSGQTVTLTLASAVAHPSDLVSVRYTRPRTNPLRGANGSAVGSISDQDVTNNTWILSWSDELTVRDFHPTPSAGCLTGLVACPTFSFSWRGASYSITGVTLSDAGGLTFSMNRAVPRSWTLHVGNLQFPVADATLSNNDKTALWSNTGLSWTDGQKVSLRLTASAPSFQSAVVDGRTLTVTFDQSLDTDSEPAPGAFYVTVNGSRRSVASGGVAVSGKTVRLTLASAVGHTDTVKVRYTRPATRPLHGSGLGRAVATFADQDVTNNTWTLSWSDELTVRDFHPTPSAGCLTGLVACPTFSFSWRGASYSITGVTLSDAGGLTFSMNRAVPRSWTLHVGNLQFPVADATLSNNDKTALWSNTGLSWTDGQKVSLRLTASAPSFQSAVVDGRTLTVTFDQSLDTDSEPAPRAFYVTVNEARRGIASGGVAVSGKTVTLTLASAVDEGDTVKVRYGRPSANPLQGAGGFFSVNTFSDQDVTNNTQSGSGLSGSDEEQVPAATVSRVAVSSSPQANDTYALGETIRITLSFTQLGVDVDTTGGTPRLKIDMDPADWGEKWASYESGSGTHSLTFAHTVVEPNISTQGIAVLENTLELNGGTIQSDGEDAGLAHTGLAHDPSHKVDWQTQPESGGGNSGQSGSDQQQVSPASVTGVSVSSSPTSGDTYRLGETIRVTLTFTELQVDVDTTGGTPRLKIDMDPAEWGEKWASYESGSGTHSLTFSHTVVEPNISTQGIAVLENSLELNGGTIQSDGADADLAHTGLAHDPSHKVDWQTEPENGGGGNSGQSGNNQQQVSPASVSRVAVSSSPQANDTYALGETIRITLTFTELQVDVDTSGGTPRLKIDMDPAEWGEKWASYESGSGTHSLTFSHTVVEPNISTQGIAVLENSLELNGGTIQSDGEDAGLAHAGLAHDASHKVDWQQSPPAANSPATGAPAITGTARVGETLTADTSGIADADGLDDASFSYQWLADGADISGATGSSYTLAGADRGKAVRVRVSFTDDAGHAETLTSAATAAVAAKPPEATAVAVTSDPGDDDTYGLNDVITISVTFDEAVDVDTTGGTPRLKIDMDPAEWGEKWASYQGGSGTATLTFTHTVVEPNISTQGIAVLENSLELNGGDIESKATDTDADLSHTGLAHDASHKVNWQQSEESPGS